MLEFTEVFNLGERLLPLVEEFIPYSPDDDAGFQSQEARAHAAWKFLKARVVGKERDGCYVIAWQGLAQDGGSEPVTLLGIIDGRWPLQLLYAHEKLVDVVSASVDRDRTLLAFTEVSYSDSDSGENGERLVTYQSFVVEVNPAGRVLALGVNRPLYQRAQFLHPNDSRTVSKDVYMLFMLHRESVGLYHFKLHQLGDVLVLAGQPMRFELCSQPVWFQWSHTYQRLYYMYNEPKVVEKSRQAPQQLDPDSDQVGESQQVLSCADGKTDVQFRPRLCVVEFADGTTHEAVLDVHLPLPIRLNKKPDYNLHLSCCEAVPDQQFNLSVLQMSGEHKAGTLCVAYQHLSEVGEGSLEYSVCILHYAYVINITLPTFTRGIGYQLHFGVLSDYLLVWIPNRLLHLLDCSAEHGASHHLLLQEDVSVPNASHKTPKVPGLPHGGSVVGGFPCTERPLSLGAVFDAERQVVYVVGVHRQELALLFAESQQYSVRAAAVHLALVHQRDTGLVRKMIDHLCRDASSPDCTYLLSEYLLAAAYSHMKRGRADRRALRLLPISQADAFRNHVEENRNGCQLVRICYTRVRSLHSDIVGTPAEVRQAPLARVIVPVQNEIVRALQQNLEQCDKATRFSLQSVQAELDKRAEADEKSAAGAQQAQPAVQRIGLLRRLSSSFTRFSSSSSSNQQLRSGGLTASPQSGTLPFLETVAEEEKDFDRQRGIVVSLLTTHLRAHTWETRERCEQIACAYADAQMSYSKSLLNIIWTALRHPSLPLPLHAPLSDDGGLRDCALFAMAEHFSAAVQSCSFPVPNGFNMFFATLGLRCLQPQIFIQYLKQHVFQVQNELAVRVVQELDDSPANAELKFQVLTRLKVADASRLLHKWDHPAARQYLSQQYVAAAMQHELKESWEVPPYGQNRPNRGQAAYEATDSRKSEDEGMLSADFPPVSLLLSVLSNLEQDLKKGQLDGYLEAWSVKCVEESCLLGSQTAHGSSIYPL